MNSDLEREITELVAQVVKKPADQIKPDTNLFAELGVDSLLGIEIFAALDKKYGIDVPEGKLKNVQTLRDIIKVVTELKK